MTILSRAILTYAVVIGCSRPPAAVREFFANPSDQRFDSMSLPDKLDVAVFGKVREPPTDRYCERLAATGTSILPSLVQRMSEWPYDWQRRQGVHIVVLLNAQHPIRDSVIEERLAHVVLSMDDKELKDVSRQEFTLVFGRPPEQLAAPPLTDGGRTGNSNAPK
jgi:hypothetical protein